MARKILAVEDDRNISDLIRMYLEKEGFEVTTAFDGGTAVEKFKEIQPDLVLLDIMLPVMDGWAVCQKIREMSRTPIIMLTAKSEVFDKVTGLEMGADDYIVKPFSPSELVARVKAHIARYERLSPCGTAAGSRLISGELQIDIAARRVFVSGREAVLTNKEFDLLTFLAQHPNQVFSKDVLFDRIWGMDSIGETSTVTVHVNRIREKIEPDAQSPRFIETVWGAGYRFKGE